jgi:rubrerythrin
MPNTYSLAEIFTFAIKIEEQGIAFYEAMAKKTKIKDAKELYLYLRDEEIKHRETFQDMLAGLEQAVAPTGETSAYLKALVEAVVFRKDDGQLKALSNDSTALDYAIDREKDSILFYIEIKEHVPEQGRSAVDKIIEEERTHIIKLLDIKEKIN